MGNVIRCNSVHTWGRVVDWKLDTAGMGVYFVCEVYKQKLTEVYRMFPAGMRRKTYRTDTQKERNLAHELQWHQREAQ